MGEDCLGGNRDSRTVKSIMSIDCSRGLKRGEKDGKPRPDGSGTARNGGGPGQLEGRGSRTVHVKRLQTGAGNHEEGGDKRLRQKKRGEKRSEAPCLPRR